MRLRVSALLAAAVLVGAAGCGDDGDEAAGTTEPTTAETTTQETQETTTEETTTAETETTETLAGDPAEGRELFASLGCGSCHTLEAAGTTGTIGPNLDERLVQDAQAAGEPLPEFTRESIVNPDAFVAPGFSAGVMPENLGEQLSDEQVDDLVAFLVESVRDGG